MRYLVGCLIGLTLGAAVARAGADATPTTGGYSSPSVQGSPSPVSYRFVPGDVIDIAVSSHPGYDRTVTIQPDGRLDLPVVGEILAAGLTPSQLAGRIRQGLNVELVDPEVTVSLKELNRGLMRRISVLGAVRNPGVFELREHSTLAEALASAGGPAPVADLQRITVTRADGSKNLVVDLSGAQRTGEVSHNLALEPGDLIMVPEGVPPTVLVLGAVARPGSYSKEGEMRVLDALSLAGGPTSKADLRRVTLTRSPLGGPPQVGASARPETQCIDLQELLTKGQQEGMAANMTLRAGDTLVVPESDRKYYVLGEVNRAEAYPLRPNDRLLDAITTAGGPTHEADLTRVSLIRKDAKGQPVATRLDFKEMMRRGEMARNEALREGDVIFVPGRRQRRPILDYFSVLYPLSGLVGVLR